MMSYFVYGKNYNSNLGQFATGIYQAPIQDYIDSGNSYIGYLTLATPAPRASPWNIYNTFNTPPVAPITTGWPQNQIDIINAISSCLNACLAVANQWIDFIVTNALPPQYLTDDKCWQTTLTNYLPKLVKQYQDKPVATKSITFYTYWYLLNIRTAFDIINQFNPWFATGVFLDYIGGFFGLSRNMSFQDNIGTQYTTLTDSQFRIVIFFNIAMWKCNFSYKGLTDELYQIFNNQINISSKQDMTITYFIKATIGSDIYVAIFAMLSRGGLPAPLGVLAKFVSITPVNKPFFALARASELSLTTSIGWGFANSSNYNQAILLGYGNFIEV